MKNVWKCDFCTATFDTQGEALEHEQACSWNPSVKSCWTCEHHVDEGMPISGSMYVCQKGLGFDRMEEMESNGGCHSWEWEEEGTPPAYNPPAIKSLGDPSTNEHLHRYNYSGLTMPDPAEFLKEGLERLTFGESEGDMTIETIRGQWKSIKVSMEDVQKLKEAQDNEPLPPATHPANPPLNTEHTLENPMRILWRNNRYYVSKPRQETQDVVSLGYAKGIARWLSIFYTLGELTYGNTSPEWNEATQMMEKELGISPENLGKWASKNE